jgi:hypothetical protein
MATEKQEFRKYIKAKFPIGTEVYDWCCGEEPYVINKRSVFMISEWKAEDYNPDFLPENVEDYWIEFHVHNPGRDTAVYELETTTTRKDIKNFWKWKKEREERIEKEKKKINYCI